MSFTGAQDGFNRTSGNSTLSLRDCKIKNSTGSKRGGVIFAQNLAALSLKSISISQAQS